MTLLFFDTNILLDFYRHGGMSLTPVAPTGSGSVSGGLPSHAPGARFATEQACREYLARLRWGQEFVCPACDGTEAWPTARGLWMCAACGHQASVIAGTIFQGTRTPLSVWFRAIWWVVSQKNGASALGLQRVLGLGSYRTAWTTSSPFGSIDEPHAIAGSSSIGSWNRPWRWVPFPTRRWSRVSVVGRRNATTTGSRDLSKGNTPIPTSWPREPVHPGTH